MPGYAQSLAIIKGDDVAECRSLGHENSDFEQTVPMTIRNSYCKASPTGPEGLDLRKSRFRIAAKLFPCPQRLGPNDKMGAVLLLCCGGSALGHGRLQSGGSQTDSGNSLQQVQAMGKASSGKCETRMRATKRVDMGNRNRRMRAVPGNWQRQIWATRPDALVRDPGVTQYKRCKMRMLP